MAEVKRVIDFFNKKGPDRFATEEALVGGSCYDAHKVAITDATMEKAKAADAVIFGAVGGPKWDKVPYDVRPEAGLLRLRKDLDLYANVRPAIVYPALADSSSLKREVVEGLDIIILRELTGGVYFGEPKTITDLGNGQKRGVDTQVYDTYEIERIGRVAFELARKRRNKVTSMEKRNVMKTGVLWNEVMTQVHAREFKDVQLEHMLADAGGMQLVRWPKQFDVIVTDNLFGDVLSDIAATLTGSLGMDDGYTKEEWKMMVETKKILDPKIKLSATCVRVPVFVGHSEAVNIEFENPITADEARDILRSAPGCLVIDKHEDGGYVTPYECVGEDATYISRIREDGTIENGLQMWVVSDNLRKGAALNAVQIAEALINRKLIQAKRRAA